MAGVVPTSEAAEVLECYRNAAAQDDFLAAFNVGVALAQGVGSQKNEEEALKWIRKAADKVVNAQYWYGRMLLEGRGAERNPQEGREWMEKAAESGMTEAQLAYGHLLITGTGGVKDHPEALQWYKKAAEAGNVDAMFSIGAMYGGGHEVPEDLVLARSWFQQAAEGGHGLAQLMMGRYLPTALAETRIWKGPELGIGKQKNKMFCKQVLSFPSLVLVKVRKHLPRKIPENSKRLSILFLQYH